MYADAPSAAEMHGPMYALVHVAMLEHGSIAPTHMSLSCCLTQTIAEGGGGGGVSSVVTWAAYMK